MKGWKLSFCFAAFTVLVLAFAGRAEAACESQYRVSVTNANCMRATWLPGEYWAANSCSYDIKVKVDIKNARDVTKFLVRTKICRAQFPRLGGACRFGASIAARTVPLQRPIACRRLPVYPTKGEARS